MTGRSGVEYHKIVEVSGLKYMIVHPNPERAWFMGVQLMKIIGEPFASMATVADEASAGQAISGAVGTLMSNINPAESFSIMKEVLGHVEHHGERKALLTGEDFTEHFRGRPGHMLKVFSAAVEFQFADFSAAIGDAIAAVFKRVEKAKAGKASQSQTGSVGLSSAS